MDQTGKLRLYNVYAIVVVQSWRENLECEGIRDLNVKVYPLPDRQGKLMLDQVRSEKKQILFLIKNITSPGTPGVVRKPGTMDRNGA